MDAHNWACARRDVKNYEEIGGNPEVGHSATIYVRCDSKDFRKINRVGTSGIIVV